MSKVSVILPNYNHANYLEKRIKSILAQTFKDYELIILDDHSPDNSRDIIDRYSKKYPEIRVFYNEQNSGSPFLQWNKGVNLAKGEYIWIAESDDFCEPNFLETLVPILDANPRVGIAHTQSYLVDERGEILNSYLENLEFIFKSDIWRNDFIKNGMEVCREWLIFHNPIPNASGALMRKDIYLECGGADPTMKLNGDWHFYSKVMMRSDLAFCKSELNYFRVHEDTQRERVRVNSSVYQEIIAVNQFISENVSGVEENSRLSLYRVASWWAGGLPFQKWQLASFGENYRLYRFFRQYRKRLWLDVIIVLVTRPIKSILFHLGLIKPLKRVRNVIFPGKYFNK